MLTIVHNATKKLSPKQQEQKEIETMKQIILASEKEMSIEEALELFRVNFPLTTCINVQDTYINYSFNNFGSAIDWVKKAENIIKSFDLPLIASAWSGDPRRAVLKIESHHKNKLYANHSKKTN